MPLDNRNPVEDLERRLQEHEVYMRNIPFQTYLSVLFCLVTPMCLNVTDGFLVLQKSTQTVRNLESEKSVIQTEMHPILAKKPLGPTASSLPPKLKATSERFDDLNTLINLYNKK